MIYYFGRANVAGHYWYSQGFHDISYHEMNALPFRESFIDAGFLNNIPDVPGKGRLFYIAGWTILTFWDRSGDQRSNSNSSFVMKGIFSFQETINKAKETFPTLFQRFNFDINWSEAKQMAVKARDWTVIVGEEYEAQFRN